jgi:lipoate-protein ligase A
MSIAIRQDGAEPGDRLMATDTDLLERSAQGLLEPTLRFYTWSLPTISLGFHQSADVLEQNALARHNMPWTRRPTGGAAVLHSEELTYAVVARLPQNGGGKLLQEYVSTSIADGLRALGIDADVDERGEPLTALPNRVSCFVRTSRWEVTVRGRKLVGSAQRRLGSAYLQHGSILTGDDHLRIVDYLTLSGESARNALRKRLCERSTSIIRERGEPIDISDLREALAASFTARFQLLRSAFSMESVSY